MQLNCSEPVKEAPGVHQQTSAQPRIGGIYRSPLLNNPASLDPARVEDIYGISVVNQVFDGLVRFNPELLIIPALAESWKIEEGGTVYRFFLRDIARFHNGRPVTARDVVFSLRRLLRAEPAPSILPHLLKIAGAAEFRNYDRDDLSGISESNELEVVVRLKEPHSPFLAAMGMHQAKVVPESEVLRDEAGFAHHPIGSGPFAFVSWDASSIRLRRFPGYFDGPAYLDGLHYAIYPGGKIEEALADFQVHRLEDLPVHGKVRQALEGLAGLKRLRRPSLSLLFYGINCQNSLLQHAGLRKALSMAIDREKLTESVYQGQFEPARSILPPGILGYDPSRPKVVNDSAAAQGKLDQSLRERLSSMPPLEIVSGSSSPLAKAEIEFVRGCWRDLGISIEPRFIPDWANFQQYLKTDQVQIYRYAWFVDLPDPDNIFQALFGSDSTVNYMHFQSGSLDNMLRFARRTILPTERAAMYQEMEDLVLAAQPLIPLVHLSIDHVYHANVHGIQLSALGDHVTSFHKVWLDPSPGPGN
jgi:ABC-type transport system substrate-binding protein